LKEVVAQTGDAGDEDSRSVSLAIAVPYQNNNIKYYDY
jgi:hypothetical protein